MKKIGCASCGGAMKKMQKGGSAEIVGMPKYGNNPRTSTGAMLKKGGSVKKYQDGGPVAAMQKAMGQKPVSTKKTMKYVRKKGSGYIPPAESNKPDTSKWVEKQASPNAKRMQKGGATKKLVKAQEGIRVKESDLKKEYTSAPRAGAEPISVYLENQRNNKRGPRLDAYKPKSIIGKNFYNDPRFSKAVELNDNFYKKERDAGTLFKKGFNDRMSEGRPKVEKDNPKLNQMVEGKKGGVAKAKFGASVPVQHSPAPGRVRSASGVGTVPVGKRKMGGVTKKLVKAQEGSIVRNTKKGRSTSNGKNFDAYENNKTGTITIARTSRNPSNSSKGVRSLHVFDDKFLKPGGNTYYKKEDVKFTKNPVNNLIKDYNTVRKSAGLPEKKYRDITTSSSQLKKEGVTQKAKGTAMKAKGQSMKADGKTLKAAAQILNKKKTGGATTAFEKLAPPYNKATFADKIAGAKKRAGKK